MFVLGSAVHDQYWLAEATGFVRDHEARLAGRPLWAFSVGTPAALPAGRRRMAATQGTQISGSLREIVRLRDHRLLSGVIRPEHLSRSGRLLFKALGCRYGNYRDWTSIDTRADAIARRLPVDIGQDTAAPSLAVRDQGGFR